MITRRIVLGTRNLKKQRELEELLAPLDIEVRTLAEYAAAVEVEETGTTFGENAVLKATQQALAIGEWVLGEDSGIAVDALQGAPGVRSARFSGEDATDPSNNRLLLKKLGDRPLRERSAHYVCHMALSDPTGEIAVAAEAICRGRIVFEPRGSAGFGYDPLFEIVEYHRTFGELGDRVKSLISHRARALRQFVRGLRRSSFQGSRQ